MRNALIDALRRQSETHYRKLFSVVTLLQFLSLGCRLFSQAFSSFSVFLLTNTLPGPSASEVTTLWRYTNLFFYYCYLLFDRFIRFCRIHARGQQTDTQPAHTASYAALFSFLPSSIRGLATAWTYLVLFPFIPVLCHSD